MACEFCGGGPATSEHIIPRWISEVLLDGSSAVRATEKPHDLEWQARKLFNATTKAFCKDCNNRFLGEIEGHTRPILTRLIAPPWGPRRLTRAEVVQLAIWAYKTALTNDPRSWRSSPEGPGKRRIPKGRYEAFRRDGEIPQHTSVWLGAWDPKHTSARLTRVTTTLPVLPEDRPWFDKGVALVPTPEGRLCWVSTVSIGPVVFRVAAPFEDDGPLFVPLSSWGIRIIWPNPPTELTWPIDYKVLDGERVDQLEDAVDLRRRPWGPE